MPTKQELQATISKQREQIARLKVRLAECEGLPGSDSIFGICVGGGFQYQGDAILQRDLDAMAAVGAKWIRMDFAWAAIQDAGPTSYNWTVLDRTVNLAAERGIKTLGIIDYTPGWARPSGTTDKWGPDPAKYAAFADACVKHCAALGVHDYEIWNEPNIYGFWQPRPDPVHYARLVQAAYPAIKNADPEANVIMGALSPDAEFWPVTFMADAYAAGAKADAVSIHPYCWPAHPGEAVSWSAWNAINGSGLYGGGPNLRQVMVANGDAGKQVWGTEFGAPSKGPTGVGEAMQAQMIREGYQLWQSYEWAGPLFLYMHRDLGTDTTTREDHFGLLRSDFSQKPSYAAYQEVAR